MDRRLTRALAVAVVVILACQAALGSAASAVAVGRSDTSRSSNSLGAMSGHENFCPNCSYHGECESDGGCQCEFLYSWSVNCSASRSELIDWGVYTPYCLGVMSAYALLDLIVICLIVYVMTGTCGSFHMTEQAAAYMFLTLAFSERIVYYTLDPGAINGDLYPWLDRLLQYLFFPLMFTAYTMVLYFWASSYLRASTGRSDVLTRMRWVFISVNVVLYAIELLVTLLQFFLGSGEPHKREEFTVLYQVYLMVILVLISSAFLYYGFKIYMQLRKFTSMSYSGMRALRSVTFMTTATALCFISGIVSNMIILFIQAGEATPALFIINDAITQSLCLIASVLVLILLGQPRRVRAVNRHTNTAAEDKVPFLKNGGSDLEEPLYSSAGAQY